MDRRFVAVALMGMALAFAIAMQSCSSDPSKVGIAEGCSLNSDCNGSLVCVFSRCHAQCAETRDCPTGQRCIATDNGKVCQLPEDNKCSVDTPCTGGLLCAGN